MHQNQPCDNLNKIVSCTSTSRESCTFHLYTFPYSKLGPFEKQAAPIHFCGLSLGAILALNYALDRPEKIDSLILINAQYKMPQFLLAVQNIIFYVLPHATFQKIGLSKKDTIQFMKSIKNLDFSKRLVDISCKTFILHGEKDKPNQKAAQQLSKRIPNAKLEIIPNAGHEANIGHPERITEIINKSWK